MEETCDGTTVGMTSNRPWFVAVYNKTKAPFSWTAPADSILEKLQRLCSKISETALKIYHSMVEMGFPTSFIDPHELEFQS